MVIESGETDQLAACLLDLEELIGQPRVDLDSPMATALEAFLDFLVGRLDVDIVYARLADPMGGADIEIVRAKDHPDLTGRAAGIGQLWSSFTAGFVGAAPDPLASGAFRIFAQSLGAQTGRLVAGSRRREFPSSRQATVIGAAAKQITFWAQTVRELADCRRAEEAERHARAAAEAANAAKDAFLSKVSHELRTPLSPILLWTTLLKMGGLTPEQHSKAIETIERCAKAQVQLIDDLLDISRIISGRLRIDANPLQLAPLVATAIEAARAAADAKGVRLQAAVDNVVAPVAGDSARLQQVLRNLLSNAVKFTPKGGCVTVTLQGLGAHAEITISDTGCGIAPEELPLIFEQYRRPATAKGPSAGPLGLGLAIVRHIVEAHGGTVRADSPGGGLGSIFTVQLPLVGMPSEADSMPGSSTDAPAATDDRSGSLDGLRVLVVDDEKDSQEAIRQLLSSCGAEVEVASSPQQAHAVLARWIPHLIISDIGMPGEDGYGFLARLRAYEGVVASLPAVALTAFTSRDDRIKILSSGFQAHVPKPVNATELIAVVSNLTRTNKPPR